MRNSVDILMYHSISDRGGPTSIAPGVFAEQMAALSASRRTVVRMDDVAAGAWPDGAVVITFDDAFEDFRTSAWPVLSRHGFVSTVYVPTGQVGEVENWTGAMAPPRPLMDWQTIRGLSEEGVAFGNHTVLHRDLTRLDDDDLATEIREGKQTLEDRLSRAVRHFAAPYGRTSAKVRAAVAEAHDTGVGTDLGAVTGDSDLYDLPRIEMYYFTDIRRWERYLSGRGNTYLAVRRGLRAIRNVLSHPAQRA